MNYVQEVRENKYASKSIFESGLTDGYSALLENIRLNGIPYQYETKSDSQKQTKQTFQKLTTKKSNKLDSHSFRFGEAFPFTSFDSAD